MSNIQQFKLEPKGIDQKSFYGKAYMICDEINKTITLYSYNTPIISYSFITEKLNKLWFGYSKTTLNHINAFMNYLEKPNFNKKTWLSFQGNKQLYYVTGSNGFVTREIKSTLFDDYDQAEQYALELEERCNYRLSYWVDEM